MTSRLIQSARVFRQGLRVGWTDFWLFWTWRSWIAAWLLRTVCSAMVWVLLGRLLGNPQTMSYLLIGNAVIAGPSAACWTIAVSCWDRWDGTYSLQVIAPSGIAASNAGRSFVWPLNGIVTSWVVFAILGVGFDLHFPPRALLLTPGLVILICLSSYSYSLFVGGFVGLAPRLRLMINFGSTNVLMALAGVSVPVSFWPRWLGALSRVLPVTHGLQAVRLAFADGSLGEIAACASQEILVGLMWLALSIAAVDRLAAIGRRDGSIDFVG